MTVGNADDRTKSQEQHGGPCELLALLRLHNYASLRRHVGHIAASTTIKDIAGLALKLVSNASIKDVGRDTIEVSVGCKNAEVARLVVQRLASLADELRNSQSTGLHLELVVAAAIVNRRLYNRVRLEEEAERALTESVAGGELVIHDAGIVASNIDRLTLCDDLERAVVEHELFLLYQPKVHVRQHRICGVEALIRWRHPSRGLILPSEFVPAAEQTRAIGAMTLWTIERAIADQKTMVARGHDLRVFINIAGALLSDKQFIQDACRLITSNRASIGFEVTETSVIRDPESAISNLKQVAGDGITVSIDDYGAGLSSLAYLKRLPAKELKIDKLFVTQLTSSNRDPLIVRSTIDLAHALEMDVVAEGVETPATLALLSVMGCDMVQGYLISKPIKLEELLTYLHQEQHRSFIEVSKNTMHNLSAAWKKA